MGRKPLNLSPEQIRERQLEYMKQYNAKHRERLNLMRKEYLKKSKEVKEGEKPRFDRKAYMRDYMNKYNAKQRGEEVVVPRGRGRPRKQVE